MNQIGITKYDVYSGRGNKLEKIGALNRLAETPRYEVSKHNLEKPWWPAIIDYGVAKELDVKV